MSRATIIIPTTCEAKRGALLHRAIDSVLAQQDADVDLVVVVNGPRVDADLRASVAAHPRTRVLDEAIGDVSLARRVGIRAVGAPYFGFVDDDDEFLPNAVRIRAAHLDADPAVDVIVTNGLLQDVTETVLVEAKAAVINADPVASFLRANWFGSPGCLFRNGRVDATHFVAPYGPYEWTDLFFTLLESGRRIAFRDDITYRKHEEHGLSVSRSEESTLIGPAFLAHLLSRPLPRIAREALTRRHQSALNAASNVHLRRNDLRAALRCHAQCLALGGWRFAPYTRAILAVALRRALGWRPPAMSGDMEAGS